jgi:hypothetical protein
MDAVLRELVRRRADHACEYCGLRQEHSELKHHVEHIIAKQHGGADHPENLALACHRCNLRKGPNLTGIDPETGRSCAFLIHGTIDGPTTSRSKVPALRVLARLVAPRLTF